MLNQVDTKKEKFIIWKKEFTKNKNNKQIIDTYNKKKAFRIIGSSGFNK